MSKVDIHAIHGHLESIRVSMKTRVWDPEAMAGLNAIVATGNPALVGAVRDYSGFPGGGYWLLIRVIHVCHVKSVVLNAIRVHNAVVPLFNSCRVLVDMAIIPLFIEMLCDEEEGGVDAAEEDLLIRNEAACGLKQIARCATDNFEQVQSSIISASSTILKNPQLHSTSRSHLSNAMSKLCFPKPRAGQIPRLMAYFTEVLTKLISAREAGEVEAEEEVGKEVVHILNGISYLSDCKMLTGINVLPLIVSVLSVPVGREEPGYGDAPVVERLVPCEQMAYAMEYLPRADLERLCMLSSDVWNCCVCANRRLYNRVRSTVCHKREVRIPAIRIIGNVMTGDDDQTQAAIDSGALRVIESVAASLRPIDASNYDKHVAAEWKELCWILSNLTAGTEDQVRLVVQSGVFYNFVMEAVRVTVAHAVAKEAVMVVANVLAIVPKETPLGWIAATFAYLSIDRVTEESLLEEYCSVLLSKLVEVQHPQLPTSLSTISTYVTDDSTPENLLLLADTYTRDDCAGSATDKFTPLMRDHVLPVLYASGRLDDNPAFTTTGDVDGNGANDEEAWQDVESTDDEV